jgi:hypothetical protein
VATFNDTMIENFRANDGVPGGHLEGRVYWKFPVAVIAVWRTQSQALPRCPSVASMVDE